jgi:hypothetical protein
VALTGTIQVEDRDNFHPQLSADGSRVVYRETETSFALSSVPSDGSSAPVALHAGGYLDVLRPGASAHDRLGLRSGSVAAGRAHAGRVR